ncbi:KamA family radical SAM protein [Candidatus Pacearchaeota archaeon]|nr:KamA family radical SAM protein [Candidatus Pacearchaeota archaeon]
MSFKFKNHHFITTIEELKQYLPLSKDEEKVIKEIHKIHPMKITKYYLSLINPKDEKDPIKKMIIPSKGELDLEGDYDASCESSNVKTVGLQHKYPQTALILTTNRCTAYCRHCFRKRLAGLPSNEVVRRFKESIDYVRNHKEIDNIILSGGDALALTSEVLEKFFEEISTIPHVKYIRIASRVPVVFPERINKGHKLIKMVKKFTKKKRICLVTHFNHPREITKESVRAVKRFLDAGATAYNQTVLLKGVNDKADILAELWNKLIEVGVLPYYLFQCRPVKRVKKHFSVSLEKGVKIFSDAKKKTHGNIICRRIKYCMSHAEGKAEIIGIIGKDIYFKWHQNKNQNDFESFFKRRLKKDAIWLDDLH